MKTTARCGALVVLAVVCLVVAWHANAAADAGATWHLFGVTANPDDLAQTAIALVGGAAFSLFVVLVNIVHHRLTSGNVTR